MNKCITILAVLIPATCVALEFRDNSLLYTDAPFTPAESAGISLLTEIGAVSGYPDGSFQPSRTLNRAEFLKIALASFPKVRVSASDAQNCFPDVQKNQWFSQYVCLAKKRGIISGYPDGQFKPERSVNYAEALKILSELYEYVAFSAEDEEWYAGYVRAAAFHKTALPIALKYDRSLTRGQMARLAAAYRANEEGVLQTYRLSEKDFDLVLSSSSSSSSTSSSSSSLSSSSSSSSSSSFHAKSHFLLLGSSDVIATGLFRPRSESVVIRNVEMKFRTEPDNIDQLFLVDAQGVRIAELTLDVFDPDDLTWKAKDSAVAEHVIPVQGEVLGLEAVIKDDGHGYSEELIQVKWLSMFVSPVGLQTDSYQLIAQNASYPPHQTAFANITDVYNNRPPVIDIEEGENLLLAEFGIDGAGAIASNVTFTLASQDGVTLDDFRLGAFHTADTIPCSTSENLFINCANIPEVIGAIEQTGIVLQLWGSLSLNEGTDPELRIDFDDPGALSTSIDPGRLGHLIWTDDSGEFRWVEMDRPMAEGSTWK